MFDELIYRLKDPRFRRPILGVTVSYLVWVLAMMGVKAAGLADGDEMQRAIGATIALLPIFGMVVFFVRLHRGADEVERAINESAAASGFIVMLLAAGVAVHLDAFALSFRLTAMHIWSIGMLGGLVGMWMAWKRYQ